MTSPDLARRGPRRAMVAAAVIALVALGASVIASCQVRARDVEAGEVAFQNRANAAVAAAKQEISRYTTALQSAGAFLTNSGTNDPAAIERYLESTDIYGQFPTITSLIFVKRVPEADVATFVASMQPFVPGLEMFDLGSHPAGTDRWIISAYVPGVRDFHVPPGIDLSSLPGLGEQAQRVATSGKAIAASLKLTPELDVIGKSVLSGTDPDVLNSEFFLEVPAWIGARGDSGRPADGMVVAAVHGFAESVANTANLQFDDLGFKLTVNLEGLGAAEASMSQVARLDGRAGPPEDAAHSTQVTFTVDGIEWTMTSWRATDADTGGLAPWLVLGFGALCSLLLGWVIYFRTRSTDRARLLREERAEQARFQEDIVQSVADAMAVVDPDGRIAIGNRAWRRLAADPDRHAEDQDASGDPAEAYLDVLRRRATAPIDDLAVAIEDTLAGRVAETEVFDVPVTIEGAPRWLAVRATSVGHRRGGAVIVHSDITERRHEQDSLVERARRDPLTGLANRDALAAGYALAAASGDTFALLYVDLDRFKQINDRYGHGAGDQVLIDVAARIRAVARADDVVARLGGDEFVVLVSSADHATAHAVARRVTRDVAVPVDVGEVVVPIGASVGVAVVDPIVGEPLEAALERADRAMYVAKTRARSGEREPVELDELPR